MFDRVSRLSRPAALGLALCAGASVAAGAAGLHRAVVSQSSGSGGAVNFLNANASGGALEGNTGSADTGIQLPFGVLGAYDTASSSPFGIGVIGVSTTGYAVAAEALSAQPSILAYAGGTGAGLEATSAANGSADAIDAEAKGSGNGMSAYADGNGEGGMFFSQSGLALNAQSYAGDDAAYIYNEGGGGGGAYIGELQGPGIATFGSSGSANEPVVAAFAEKSGTDVFAAYNGPMVNGNATYSNFRSAFVSGASLARGGAGLAGASDLQISGDIFVYGRIFQDCAAFPVVSSTICSDVPLQSATTTIASPSTHGDVAMYPARETLPSVEDYGSGHLVAGRAYVALDPAFAGTISRTQPYMVIVTPGGQSHGVYVSDRTTAGFEVHENDAGRDTVDFDYRIVARPLADTSARLAAVPTRTKHGASAAAFQTTERGAKAPAIRHIPAIDPSFTRMSAAFRTGALHR